MINKIILFFKGLGEREVLLLLIGVTFGLRLYAVLMAKGIAYDSAGYGFMARDFIKGDFVKGLSSALHPLYPFLISLISPDTGHVEITGRLISLFFGTMTLIPIFYLIKEALGPKEAALSGLFYTFHPYLVTYSGMLLSEATYWGLLTLSVYFFWTGLKKKNVFRSVVSGIFLGLSYLTRPEGITYLFVYIVWIIFYGGLRERWIKKIFLLGGVVLTIFIIAIPYITQIHRETGKWLITKKAMAVQEQWIGRSGEKDDHLTGLETFQKKKPGEKGSQILGLSKNIIHYIPLTFYHYLRAYHFSLWLFLFLAWARVMRKDKPSYEVFLASLILFHLISLSTFTSSTIRYSVPVIPLSLFWAGSGGVEIKRLLKRIGLSKPERWVSFLIIFLILIQLPQSLKPERKHREELKKVGLWLKENTPEDAMIMGNSPIEIFYADRRFILLPPGISTSDNPAKTYEEIISLAKREGIEYILFNQNAEAVNPDFLKSIRPSELKAIYQYREKDNNVIFVYEFVH